MGREAKSRRCRSSLPSSLFPSTSPLSLIPFFFWSPSPLTPTLLPPFLSFSPSLKHVSGRTVWSCQSLKSPDRNLACCCSAGCHCDICIRQGRSVGQQVQVSSLTGSCPYLVQVAPSDRLKVRADLLYIYILTRIFYFLSFSCPHNGQ